MPPLSFKKQNLPFLLSGSSEITIETGDAKLNKKLDESLATVFSAGVSGSSGSEGTLGQSGTVSLKISASAGARLTPVFASTTGAAAKLLTTYGVGGFFKTPGTDRSVVLAFEAGATADAGVSGEFRFAPLKASTTLDAGVNAAYTYVKPLDKELKVQELLGQYFKTMRLPEQASDRALEPGEAIFLKYGGYLKLGAEASAGFQMRGSKDFSLGKLALSEQYDLSIVGKIGLKAAVAGQFSVLMTAAEDPGWTAVQVRRHNAKSFAVAADIKVDFTNELPLPETADEFLGAALGVNAQNFLNVLNKAQDLADLEELKKQTDALARRFISEFIGKGFDKLESGGEFNTFMGRLHQVVTSYHELDRRAITLFDRYFDRLGVLTGFLDELAALEQNGLATLRSRLTPELWNIFSQLTDGDPIGFLLPEVTIDSERVDTAGELRNRAKAVLALLQDQAHAEIRDVVKLAKTSFGIDMFFRELAKVDTKEELRVLANDKIGEFVSRLVGRTLDSSANLDDALKRVKAALGKLADFRNNLFAKFKEAANSSFKFSLHAGYSRASERDALIDVQIRAGHARGPELLRLAGLGDFEKILTTGDTDLVRLREGVFTHKTTREKAFKVNIVGWHFNWNYAGFDRVITQSEQRLVAGENGITVHTTLDLTVDRKRKRQDETVHVNFLLRALGASKKVVKANAAATSFLVDTLTSLSTSYTQEFTDENTSVEELQDYLAFASELGLDKKGATLGQLQGTLPKSASGDFGDVRTKYTVRFGEDALEALLGIKVTPVVEMTIRKTMRRILLTNYLKGGPELHDIAFAYATHNTFLVHTELGPQFSSTTLPLELPVNIDNPGIKAPSTVVLDKFERTILVTLYQIENQTVKAITDLYAVLNSGKSFKPDDFEKKLAAFGSALTLFDDFDQSTKRNQIGTNSIFAVFDALVRHAAQGTAANIAVLEMNSSAGDVKTARLFMTDAAAES
jgi:hypothetical protein